MWRNLAGVSISTVSKALSGGGRMREETREKVVSGGAIPWVSVPTAWRRACTATAARTIGILSTDRFGRFTFPIVEAMEEILANEGIGIFMCNATDDPAT